MTDPRTADSTPSQPERLDELLDRIVDGVADEREWSEFRALAGVSTEPWRRLAEQQRLMNTLRAGFDREVAPALSVELPSRQSIDVGSSAWRFAAWRPALGWAAAAVLGFAWAATALLPEPAASADSGVSLLARYLEQPHVVGELPAEIHTVSANDGGGEVVTYIRQIVERRPVNLYNLQLDENSNPVLRQTSSEPTLLASRY